MEAAVPAHDSVSFVCVCVFVPAQDATVPDCYQNATSGCSVGYIDEGGGLCCDGRDAHVPVATPPFFGFDTTLATPQVAATSQANCGCVFTVPPNTNSSTRQCNLGHYAGAGHYGTGDFIECNQYFTSNGTTGGALASIPFVSPEDDAAFLVDNFEAFAREAVGGGQPFFAQISFHNNHIPYISAPQYRARYAARGLDLNAQDYYGGLTGVDAQVGRILALLETLGVSGNTFVSLSSDNGPENNVGGHDAAPCFNPGLSGGLVGRKRALTEGGIRSPSVVSFPPLVLKVRRGGVKHVPLLSLCRACVCARICVCVCVCLWACRTAWRRSTWRPCWTTCPP